MVSISVRGQKSNLDSLFSVSIAHKNDTAKIKLLLELSRDYFFSFNYKKGHTVIDSAINLASRLNNRKGLAVAYNNKGNAFSNEGRFEESIQFHFKSLKLREELNLPKEICKSFLNIGNCFLEMKDYHNANNYTFKALELLQKNNDDRLKAFCYNNLGLTHRNQNKLNESLNYYLKAFELSEKVNNPQLKATLANNLGEIYSSINKPDQALEYYLKCDTALNLLDDIALKINCYTNLGDLFTDKKDYAKAKIYAGRLTTLLKDEFAQSRFYFAFQFLSRFFEETGENEKALFYLKLYASSKDSIFNSDLAEKVNELNAKFEVDKKNSKIELLVKDTEKKDIDLKLEKSRKTFILIISITLFVLISSFFIFYTKTARQKQAIILSASEKEKLKAELTLLKDQISPHMMFNTLNSILFQIDENSNHAKESILIFSELLRYQLYESNTPLLALDKEINYISKYITLCKLRKSDRCEITFDIKNNTKDVMIAPLLFIPLVENAFKYVTNEKHKRNFITVFLEADNKQVIFSVENSQYETKTTSKKDGGIGLTNLKNRLNLLYHNKHELTIINEGDVFKAKLILTY